MTAPTPAPDYEFVEVAWSAAQPRRHAQAAMSGDVGALGTVAAVLADHWLAGMAPSGEAGAWQCDCGEPLEMSESAHRAHVAAEVVKALGAETRVECAIRYDPDRPLIEGYDEADMRRTPQAKLPDGDVWLTRTVTTFRHEGEWTEVQP